MNLNLKFSWQYAIILTALAVCLIFFCSCENDEPEYKISSGLTNGKSYQLTKVANVTPTMVNLWFINEKGDPDSLSNYIKEKYAMLYIWKTGCGICNATIPNVIKVASERKDLVVLGISLRGNVSDYKSYISEKGYNFPNLLSDGATGAYYIYSTFGTVSGDGATINTPTIVLINKDFTVYKKTSGLHTKATLDNYLNDMMK
ncbi:MAG: TlpA family protein disulfide reductase [Bacteroidetes bacterium]|nr:TlpA family protein disulfide reductase [Bacteroidota bacterium]